MATNRCYRIGMFASGPACDSVFLTVCALGRPRDARLSLLPACAVERRALPSPASTAVCISLLDDTQNHRSSLSLSPSSGANPTPEHALPSDGRAPSPPEQSARWHHAKRETPPTCSSCSFAAISSSLFVTASSGLTRVISFHLCECWLIDRATVIFYRTPVSMVSPRPLAQLHVRGGVALQDANGGRLIRTTTIGGARQNATAARLSNGRYRERVKH